MESLSIDRYVKDLTGYVRHDVSPVQTSVYSNPSLFSYSKLVMPDYPQQTSLFYGISGVDLPPLSDFHAGIFDSNSYMNFGGGYDAVLPQTSFWDFLRMPLLNFPPLNIPEFKMPQINLPALSKKPAVISAEKVTTAKKSNFNIDTSVKFNSLTDAGYNSSLGKMLAQEVASHAHNKSTGYCAKYVSNAMDRLGIAGKRGDAWQLADSLRENPHFKEIDVRSVDPKKLPAGCVLVYPQGSAGYSKQYGHVEIALGNGKAASDFVNNNIKIAPDMKIFAPVSA